MTTTHTTINHPQVSIDDQPSLDGELLVAKIRLLLVVLAFAFSIVYGLLTPHIKTTMLAPFWVSFAAWGTTSILIFNLARRDILKPWISFGTVALDISFVTFIQIQAATIFDLSFISNLAPSLFFMVVGLAALRRCARLVLVSGLISSIIFLLINSVLFLSFFASGHVFIKYNDQLFWGISFLDPVIKAMIIAIFGWLISHVTQSIRESERHYFDLFEHIPDGILITDTDGIIKTVNDRFAKMTGLPSNDLINKSYQDFINIGDDNDYTLPSVSPSSIGNPTVLHHGNQTKISVLISAVQMEEKKTQLIILSVRDITQQATMEHQLIRAQKMETIGKLAGGLTHDFKNFLGGIIGAASMATRTTSKLPENQRDKLNRQMAIVRECGENASDVIKTLLSFSRNSSIETKHINLCDLISNVIIICRNTFGPRYSLNYLPETNTAYVNADHDSLTQAILNLCINAKDAMPDGGTITIRLSSAPLDRHFLAKHPDASLSTGYWIIEIEDTGARIGEEALDKIFDPLLSTKFSKQKLDLGLPLTYSITQQHGGFMDVKTKADQGTSFTIFLPCTSMQQPLKVTPEQKTAS